MADFAAIYFIQNDGGTYRAFDTAGNDVFNGTSLVTDVLNAIEGAHVGNFAVHFGIGTFDMGTENWTLNAEDDILITGQGIDITIVQNSSTAAADTEPFSFTNCDRITIRDLTVSAGGTARSTSDALDFDDSDECLVERVKVILSRGSGIVFDGKDAGAQALRNTIRGCIVTGADLEGIQLLAADDTVVDGCFIHGNGEVGIKLNRKTSATVQNCEGTTIKGCIIESNDESGIEVLECEHTTITGNIIRNNGQTAGTDDGILIDDFATAGLVTDVVVIVGNLIYDDQGTATQDRGVNVLDAAVTGVVIEGNSFSGHLTEAINDVGTLTMIRGNGGAPDNIVREISGTLTIDADDPARIFNCDTSGGVCTPTLPAVADVSGQGYMFHRDGASNVVVTRAGSDTFDDAATTKTLADDGAGIGITSIGDTEWKINGTQGSVT